MELNLEKDIMEKIVMRIDNEIQKRGYTKLDLSNNLGWPPSKLSKIFSLGQKLTVEDLIAIGIELKCNPAVFLLGEEEMEMRIEGKTLRDIFSAPRDDEGFCRTFINKLKNEVPSIIQVYLDLNDETTEVKAKIRIKGMAQNKIVGVVPGSLPRVVVNDKSVGTLYGQEISIGYWLCEDLTGMFLAINYNSDETKPNNEYENRKTILNRARFFRELINEPSLRSTYPRFGKKDDPKTQRYEDGMIKAKFYKFDDLPSEDVLKNDLIEFYNNYKTILSSSVKRVKRNYLGHDGAVNIDDLAQNLDDLQGEGAIDWYTTIRRGPQRSLYNALERENYTCEIDKSHETFVQERNGKPYMEAVHLIPVTRDADFKMSLRVEPNVCCLCASCSAKLKYATKKEKQDMLMILYLKHKKSLEEVGIDITPIQLLNYYGIN